MSALEALSQDGAHTHNKIFAIRKKDNRQMIVHFPSREKAATFIAALARSQCHINQEKHQHLGRKCENGCMAYLRGRHPGQGVCLFDALGRKEYGQPCNLKFGYEDSALTSDEEKLISAISVRNLKLGYASPAEQKMAREVGAI